MPPFRRSEPGRTAPAETNLTEIKQVADRSLDVNVFVAWLKTRTNVSHVGHSRLIWLTSNPPQQEVHFTLDGSRHELTLTADVEVLAQTLATPHDRTRR